MRFTLLIAAAAALVSSSAWSADGKVVYGQTCGVCHATGVAGAPKLGDKAAWAPRIKLGKDALYKSAISGKPGTGMVAKGGAAQLSDADVKAIVDMMMAKAK